MYHLFSAFLSKQFEYENIIVNKTQTAFVETWTLRVCKSAMRLRSSLIQWELKMITVITSIAWRHRCFHYGHLDRAVLFPSNYHRNGTLLLFHCCISLFNLNFRLIQQFDSSLTILATQFSQTIPIDFCCCYYCHANKTKW